MNMIPKYDMDEAIAVFAGSLTIKNAIKWLKLPRTRQEQIVIKAFKKGVLNYKSRGQDEKLH